MISTQIFSTFSACVLADEQMLTDANFSRFRRRIKFLRLVEASLTTLSFTEVGTGFTDEQIMQLVVNCYLLAQLAMELMYPVIL